MNNVKLINLKIDEIQPYWRNPRNIEKAVESVKKSIELYGYNNPIIVDKNKVIIAGHTRYRALKELNYEEVNVIIADLDEEKAKQFRIVDNKTNELAKWDNELLMFEMREIEGLEDIKTFFSDKEFKNMGIDLEDFENELQQDENYNNQIIDNEENNNTNNIEDEKNNKKLEKVKENEENKFEQRSNEIENDYIEVVCPHCEKNYTLSKRELLQSDKIRK